MVKRIRRRSRGAVLFAQLGETQEKIAAKMKCTQEEVSCFQNGKRLPGPVNRTKIKKIWGILETAWDEEPTPVALHTSAHVDSVDGRAERLQRTIDAFQEAALSDPEMTTRERLATLGSAIDCLRDLAKLTGESQDISEAKLLKFPVMRKVVEELLRALEPWPDAMRAAGEALKGSGG